MPSTATIASSDFSTFVTKTTISSSAVNANFNVWRGHLLPVDASSSAAANRSYDLGSSDYFWKDNYSQRLIFGTTGTGTYVEGLSLGEMSFNISSASVAKIGTSGVYDVKAHEWINQASAPSNPVSGSTKMWINTATSIILRDSAGTETTITAGGAGGGGAPDNHQIKLYLANTDGTTEWTLSSADSILPDFAATDALAIGFTSASTGDALYSNDSADNVYVISSAASSQYDAKGFDLNVPKYARGRDLLLELQYRTKDTSGDSADGDYMIWVFDKTNGVIATAVSTGSQTAGTSIEISSSTGMAVNDKIWIGQTGGTDVVTEAHITAIADSTHVTINEDVNLTAGDNFVTGILTDVLTTLDAADSDTNEEGKSFKVTFLPLATTAQITVLVQQLTAQTDSFLYFDGVLLTSDPIKKVSAQGIKETGFWYAKAGYGSTNTLTPYFTNEEENTFNKTGSITNDSTSGLTFTAKMKCVLSGMFTADYSGTGEKFGFNHNGTPTTAYDSLTGKQRAGKHDGERGSSTYLAPTVMQKGEVMYLSAVTGNNENDSTWNCRLTAEPLANEAIIVESTDSVMSDITDDGTITISGTTSAPTKASTTTHDKLRWSRSGRFMECELTYRHTSNSGAAAGSGDYLFQIVPDGYQIDSNDIDFYTTVEGGGAFSTSNIVGYGLSGASNSGTYMAVAYDTTNVRLFGTHDAGDGVVGSGHNNITEATCSYNIKVRVPIAGWDANPKPLLALPTVTYGQEPESYIANTHAGFGSTDTKIPYFTNVPKNSISNLGTVTNDSTNGFIFEASARCRVTISYSHGGTVSSSPIAGISLNSSQLTTNIESIAAADRIAINQQTSVTGETFSCPVSATLIMEPGDKIRPHTNAQTPTTAANNHLTLLVEPIQGVTNQAAIISQPTVYIKDIKSDGSDGGTATAGSFVTRVLNTLEGQIAEVGVTLSSNQFTLPAGTYEIYAKSNVYGGTHGHKNRIQNITDSKTVTYGTNGYSDLNSGADENDSWSHAETVFTITKSTTFELQHEVQTTVSTNGWGIFVDITSAADETYSVVKITRKK